MNDHDYLFYPSSGLAQIPQHISHRVVPERVYAFATLNAILFYIRYIVAFGTELLQANEIWYVLVCPIRAFPILRQLKIIKYVQNMLAGGRHVHKWTHKAKMAVFLLFTCVTEPFVGIVRISGDHIATPTATLTNVTRALIFTFRFLFMVISAHLTPKVSVALVTSNSRPRVLTRRTYHSRYMSVHKCVPRHIHSLCYNPRKRIV